MRENSATTFSIYGIAQLVKQAFELAFTPRNILSGLRSNGICPLNPDVFTGDDFASSVITDQPPSASTTNLNSSRMELTEESLPGKDMDELNNACEDVASYYRPETDTGEVLAVPCSSNEDVGDCNSFATEPIRKRI